MSLFSIIAVAYTRSCGVSARPASCARSSSAARMSTLTMLAVSNADVPSYTAPSVAPSSAATATETRASPSGSRGFSALASASSRSTETSSSGADADASPEEGADAVAATGTACPAPPGEQPMRVPTSVPVSRAAHAASPFRCMPGCSAPVLCAP
ncbi:hypothetical protein ACFQ0Q_09450 [Streptomyces aureus]